MKCLHAGDGRLWIYHDDPVGYLFFDFARRAAANFFKRSLFFRCFFRVFLSFSLPFAIASPWVEGTDAKKDGPSLCMIVPLVEFETITLVARLVPCIAQPFRVVQARGIQGTKAPSEPDALP